MKVVGATGSAHVDQIKGLGVAKSTIIESKHASSSRCIFTFQNLLRTRTFVPTNGNTSGSARDPDNNCNALLVKGVPKPQVLRNVVVVFVPCSILQSEHHPYVSHV